MPRGARLVCNQPGCGQAINRGLRYCVRHQRQVYRDIDRQRGNATARGYDADWRALRAAYLAQHPLCECDDCQGGALRVTPATVVDHRKPIAERPDLRLEWSNLRAMSKPHHDRHTARAQGFASRRR